MNHCYWCPFKACLECPCQGGKAVAAANDTGGVRHMCGKMGMSSGTRTAPAGNRGLTTTTEEES